MSLAARKSDLKSHLSRSTKKHLNLSNSATLPEESVIHEKAVSITDDSAFAKIDLGDRPSSEGFGPSEHVVHRV